MTSGASALHGLGDGVKFACLAADGGLRGSADWSGLELGKGRAALAVEAGGLVGTSKASAVLRSV